MLSRRIAIAIRRNRIPTDRDSENAMPYSTDPKIRGFRGLHYLYYRGRGFPASAGTGRRCLSTVLLAPRFRAWFQVWVVCESTGTKLPLGAAWYKSSLREELDKDLLVGTETLMSIVQLLENALHLCVSLQLALRHFHGIVLRCGLLASSCKFLLLGGSASNTSVVAVRCEPSHFCC